MASLPPRPANSSTPAPEVNNENENSSNPPSSSRKRTITSDVWNYFTSKGLGADGKPRAQCKGCGVEYIGGGSSHGTSSLSRHISKCPKLCSYHDVGDMLIDHAGKLRSRKLNQKVAREYICRYIIRRDLSFATVEHEEFREMLSYFNPDFKPVSRNTISGDIWKMYLSKKEELKEELSKIPSRICLTSDIWTACTTEGYICLTAHYVSANWTLKNKIISFIGMPPPHSGHEMCKKVLEMLREWGIEKKIFSITLDNASSNYVFQELLKDQLNWHNYLICDGEFFHVRCCAHILNLIVQEGLKIAHDALYKIRESVKYVKGSEARKKKFEAFVKGLSIEGGVHLRLDCPTRWNSTYLLLESALKYRQAFSSFPIEDENFKCGPSNEEWDRGERMCIFLKPFYEITTLMSGSTYPTSNLYFMQIWSVETLLLKEASKRNESGGEARDDIITSMAIKMKEKFDKYWSEYSTVLAFGAVLDPRFKFPLLEYCFKEIDPTSSYGKVEVVRTKLFHLYDAYCDSSSGASSDQSQTLMTSTLPPRPASSSSGSVSGRSRGTGSGRPPSSSAFQALKVAQRQLVNSTGKSQLETYLEEPQLDMQDYEDLDVLQFWKDNRKRFPNLSRMAMDILSIPITTVASESAFSIGSRVLNKYRSVLLPSKLQALICTRNWIRGFQDDEDKDIDQEDDNATEFEVDSSDVVSLEEDDED